MEEGSLRCDANISIRLKGEKHLGTRVEVKNLNSIRNIKKAIEYEIERLIEITETGGTILQQTRSFDANNDTTFSIRDKEDANDYRYFPDPDLAPFHLTSESIEALRTKLPTLPNALQKLWKTNFKLSDYDVEQLSENKEEANYFIQLTLLSNHYKAIANWILGPIRAYLNEPNASFEKLNLIQRQLVELIDLVETNQLNFSVASNKILKEIIATPQSPIAYATANNLLQSNSTDEIENWVNQVLAKHPEKVIEYKKGKKGLIGLFVGEVKKISQGKADPKLSTSLLEKKLAE
jgi:aspartyl-tRNA(Asn)/glutamyl-tRNA(Gln) amidotransferase subunit B